MPNARTGVRKFSPPRKPTPFPGKRPPSSSGKPGLPAPRSPRKCSLSWNPAASSSAFLQNPPPVRSVSRGMVRKPPLPRVPTTSPLGMNSMACWPRPTMARPSPSRNSTLPAVKSPRSMMPPRTSPPPLPMACRFWSPARLVPVISTPAPRCRKPPGVPSAKASFSSPWCSAPSAGIPSAQSAQPGNRG